MKRPRSAEGERRRAEDRFREEHHDAHARTLIGSSTFGPDGRLEREDPLARPSATVDTRVRIRITKTPPALFMDGFDVRGFRAGHVYEVDSRTGAYLQIAGYGVSHPDGDNGATVTPRREDSGKVEPT